MTFEQIAIGKLATVRSGFAFKSRDWLDAGVPVVKIGNVKAGWISLDGCSFVSERVAREAKEVELRPGDVLISMTGHIGEVAKVRGEGRMLLNQRVGRFIVHDSANLDREFLYFCLQAPDLKQKMVAHAYGVAQPNISPSLIEQQQIPLPPVATQRRIVAILSAYDDLIANNQRRIEILEAMARALYREWFVEFRFPGYESVELVPSDLGAIPQGWSFKSFGELATITMGLSPKGDTYNDRGDGTPLINGPVEFGERFTRAVKWTTFPTKLSKEGDLIVCVRGSTTGKFVKSDGVYCLGRGVCAISSDHQAFVDQLFTCELPDLLAKTGGSTFPSWTGPQLKSHKVLSPPPELIARFGELTRPMAAAVLQHSRQVENLRATRDLLLPRLLSGQVSLADTAA